jgi:hypothetical protein
MHFESQWTCHEKSSRFYDPLQNPVLARLSRKAREEVQSRMEWKLGKLSSEFEAKYHQTKAALDAQGVFHPSVNHRRAQSMCLVELTRQCSQMNQWRKKIISDVDEAHNPYVLTVYIYIYVQNSRMSSP